MGNDQPALRALFACESGLSEPEIGLEHAFVLLIWAKRSATKFARCPFAKTTANCSNSFCHFHLIFFFFFNNLTINKIEGQDNGTEVPNRPFALTSQILRVSSRCSLTRSVRVQQPHTAQELTILIQNYYELFKNLLCLQKLYYA
jgi:hypothetical protein